MAIQRTEAAHAPVGTVPHGASTYWLDADDRIVRVNRAWREFARANGAPMLEARVVGHQVWDFIDGPHLRHLLRELFDRVRHTGRRICVHYRCDGPSVVRTFALHVQPDESGTLACASELLAESRRSPVSLLDMNEEHSAARHLVLCSWCKRAYVGEWLDLEDAVRLLGLLHETPVPPISHGLCPDCDRGLRAQIE